MSNTIKLKRGSGSDPSASDLSIGEIAIRTDSGKLFTKKDNGSVAEISGSGGIDDGDKGDITVSNGGDTFTIDNGVVTSAKIADGTIVNADINASAAIAGSKINPNFGSQDITTTGELQCKDMSLIDTTPKLTFFDSDNNPDFTLSANSGSFRITDSTNSAERLVVNSDGHVDVLGNLDVGSGLDVTGNITTTGAVSCVNANLSGELNLMGTTNHKYMDFNIGSNLLNIRGTTGGDSGHVTMATFARTGSVVLNFNGVNHFATNSGGVAVTGNMTVTGTVDGVDIATRDTLFGGLTSSSGVLTNGVTATTQSAGNNTTRVATTAFVSTAIANLIDSSPSTLNTLNELASALGDDPNFATTVTNSIATKLPLAGGTLTGNLELSSTYPSLTFTDTNHNSDYRITNNDGQLIIYDITNSAHRLNVNSDGHVDILGNLDVGAGIDVTGNISVSGTVDGRDLATDGSKLDGIESGATADQSASEILTLIKTVDGAGSGLDADTLDGISSASFLRSDANDTSSGTIAFGTGSLDPDSFSSHSGGFGGIQDGSGWSARGLFVHGGGTGDAAAIAHNGSKLFFGIQNGSSINSMETWLDVTPNSRIINFQTDDNSNNVRIGGNKIFHAGNDGSGSGLDSDLLDGQEGSYYRNASNINAGTLPAARLPNHSASLLTSGTIPAARIGSNAVTFARMQDIAEERLIGRVSSGSGDPEALTQAQVRTFLGLASSATTDTTNASNISSGTIPDARLPNSISSSITGNAATATKLATARTIAGVSFDGSANISLNNNAITNGAGYITSSNSAITNKLPLAGGTMTGELQINARLDVGNGSGNDHEIRIYKADNNVSDHIQFYNGTTRIGEIGCEDGTWLRINQETNKNIYTPRYIRADNGFFVDGTLKGINGSGNFIGGTIAGASDYGTLLRSNAADTASGDITFSGGAGAVTIAANSDITLNNGTWSGNAAGKIQHHNNILYFIGGSGGFKFRESGTDRWNIDGSGHFTPHADSTYNIGSNSVRVANGYFDTLYGDGSNLTGISAGATGGGSDEVFYENDQAVTTNYTITNGKNAMAAGPITINSGVTVTVGSGETLTIV